ncbi:MAG: hypothetical protein ACREBB_01560 [Nitrosotalea sp.]
MNEIVKSDSAKILSLSYTAAAATVIAGIIHVLMGAHPESDEQAQGIFFLVGGILQIFWVLPVIKGWNKIWQYVGIGGTAVMIILWAVTHIHGLTHGRGLGGMTLPLEISQIAFIGLCIVLLKVRPTMQKEKIV